MSIFRKRSTYDPGNGHPVAILPAIAEIFERIAFRQIYWLF